jgi:acetate kinase
MRRALVVNAGSTSLKLSLVDDAGRSAPIPSLDTAPADVALVAHRVVHGGSRFRSPVVLADGVIHELEAVAELAPLHNGPALRAIAEARAALPQVPHVAVFDTAFHATIPEIAFAYALPERWREDWGIRRYGFHGLSVQWAAEQVPAQRLVVCHLGGGCSVTAVLEGRSIDTTMGFSPLEGVPMATRSGSVDPEAVLHLLRTGRRTVDQLEHDLERESGLLGLSGATGRVEELESLATPEARRALDVFAYRIALAVGAMSAALGGLDALAFTGGVGEGSARVRADVCARLAHLGVELDPAANARPPDGATADLHASRGPVRVAVVHAQEDVVAARAAFGVLAGR